jgi:SAM-dependent methyltransferase
MIIKTDKYVHGYSHREEQRLHDQAGTLTELLHHDTGYPAGSRVLEAGCGVGAQTAALAESSPETRIISVDISGKSIRAAEKRAGELGLTNVKFMQADIFNLPFDDASFDHLFLCFVLEHLPEPVRALQVLKGKLKPGGTITAIEGDHGSTFFHPASDAAWKTIQCLVDIQKAHGGDALIGRRLYPLLEEAGFHDVLVSPRMVYVDDSRPELVQGFTRDTFVAMVKGVERDAIALEMITSEDWDRGMRELEAPAEGRGTFCYSFFKARAHR